MIQFLQNKVGSSEILRFGLTDTDHYPLSYETEKKIHVELFLLLEYTPIEVQDNVARLRVRAVLTNRQGSVLPHYAKREDLGEISIPIHSRTVFDLFAQQVGEEAICKAKDLLAQKKGGRVARVTERNPIPVFAY